MQKIPLFLIVNTSQVVVCVCVCYLRTVISLFVISISFWYLKNKIALEQKENATVEIYTNFACKRRTRGRKNSFLKNSFFSFVRSCFDPMRNGTQLRNGCAWMLNKSERLEMVIIIIMGWLVLSHLFWRVQSFSFA